jgi:hypothetical protein
MLAEMIQEIKNKTSDEKQQTPTVSSFKKFTPKSDVDISAPEEKKVCNIVNVHMMTTPTVLFSSLDIVDTRSLVNERKNLENFTDDQLNRIALDRNIPEVYIYPRERKIQTLLSDPRRHEYNKKSSCMMNEMSIGDLLYLAVNENVAVHLIPDRFNVRRILVSLILYQRKRADLIEHGLLTDDDMRTIVSVLQVCKDVNFAWFLERHDLEKIIDGVFFEDTINSERFMLKSNLCGSSKCEQSFLPRWRRYEVLKILPKCFLQSVSFQLSSSQLGMCPSDNYIIARLIDLPENPFEIIYARDRNIDRQILKEKYGIVVPRTWNEMDYIGLNGRFYPLVKKDEDVRLIDEAFSLEKMLTIGTKEGRRKYLSEYDDITIFNEIKSYVSYNSRPELIENILTLFDSTENIYFVSLLPQLQGKIYYGNYASSEIYSSETLASKLNFLTTQNYPLEDKIMILKKVRQLQNLLLAMGMMTQGLASSISRLITTYECIPDAQPLLYYFLILQAPEIANSRRSLYQKFYYDQTRNCLYLPITKCEFIGMLPNLSNVNHPIPKCEGKSIHDSTEELYDTIAYMKLFFGYLPHSIKNF